MRNEISVLKRENDLYSMRSNEREMNLKIDAQVKDIHQSQIKL